jgi:hypothetical protein
MLPIRSRWTVHGLSKRLLFYSVTAEMVIFSATCVQFLCIGFDHPETPKSSLVSIPFPHSYFSITRLSSVSSVLWTISPLRFLAHGLFSEAESQIYSHHFFGMATMAHPVTVTVLFVPLYSSILRLVKVVVWHRSKGFLHSDCSNNHCRDGGIKTASSYF